MRVRSIRRKELPALLELYTHLHRDDTPPPRGSRLNLLWQTILDDPNTHYIVAVEDDEIVSSCVLTIILNLTRGARPYGLIENVVTHSDYRRQGFGTAVMQKALEIAWRNDCYKVMLMSGRNDEGTMQFYESAGFIRGQKTGFIARPGD